MNEELIKTIKEFHIKQQKLLNEMTNYSKSQIISIIEREMNENHYLRNEIDRLNNIISEIERLIINHNCDTGDIYYKYNGKYLRSELKERIMELVELKENNNA